MTRFEFVRSRLLAPPPPLFIAVPLAIPFIIAPTLLRSAVDGVVTGTTFVTYFPFVLLAAIFLGWRAAVVVMLASAAVANFLFMTPRHALFADAGDTLGAIFFAISSSLIIALADTLRRTFMKLQEGAQREAELNAELQDLNADLRHLNSELQHRVKNTLAVVQGLAVQTFRGTQRPTARCAPSEAASTRLLRRRMY